MNDSFTYKHRARLDLIVHSVEVHFDGPTACGSGQAAHRCYFPRLEVLSTLAHRAASA